MMTRLEPKLAQTHVALTGPTRQQVLQLIITRLQPKLAQNHVTLTGSTRQQVLQLMITRLESKLAQTHVALTGPTRQQVLQMMTRLLSNMTWAILWISTQPLKSLKISLRWAFLSKVYEVWAKQHYRGATFHDTESDAKFE